MDHARALLEHAREDAENHAREAEEATAEARELRAALEEAREALSVREAEANRLEEAIKVCTRMDLFTRWCSGAGGVSV